MVKTIVRRRPAAAPVAPPEPELLGSHPHPARHVGSHVRGPHGTMHVLNCRTCGGEVFEWTDADPAFYGQDVVDMLNNRRTSG